MTASSRVKALGQESARLQLSDGDSEALRHRRSSITPGLSAWQPGEVEDLAPSVIFSLGSPKGPETPPVGAACLERQYHSL